MQSLLKKITKDIRTLKVQGARNIAKVAVETLVECAELSKAKTKKELYSELLSASKVLEDTRPTEPMMRNSLDDTLRFVLAWIQTQPDKDISLLKKDLGTHYSSFLDNMDISSKKIAQYGAEQIPQGANILIHCHSSTLIKTLQCAHDMKKNIHVVCLETRPLYQGRISARALSGYGIDTTIAVDSSVGTQMQKMDLVLTGADAITAEGDLINKIGTFTIAQLAHLHSVRFMCASEIYKYDPLTRFGKIEPIEQRDLNEVWGTGLYAKEVAKEFVKIPKNLKVQNPAFDRTPASLIRAYITEEGIVPPAQLAIIAEQKINGEKYGNVRV